MNIKNPTKELKEVLEYLGPEYAIRLFDMEQCIYRDLGNGYDIEVSGLNNNCQKMEAVIFVWDVSNGKGSSARMIERIDQIEDREKLKGQLDAVVKKYFR